MQQDDSASPPVHDDGPATEVREVAGGDHVEHVGVDALIMEEFKRIITEVAARNTRVAVVAPLRQLVDAVMRIVTDLPRIPDYDDVTARSQTWEESSDYSPFELSDTAPGAIKVYTDGAEVVHRHGRQGDPLEEIRLDPESAEQYHLAGLAAARHAKTVRDANELARERARSGLVLPAGFERP